ncbi:MULTISPECIES: hypothetical protein [unclassified Bradyrhizobium]|uniref:hypothetical protein n=1 Tax=unclassified Bradyrhizobium TaxID=2631580 RepID=UPI0023065DDB|nr:MULTISPECIES: hypothetical protein [unclassified Bradyrhizobium]
MTIFLIDVQNLRGLNTALNAAMSEIGAQLKGSTKMTSAHCSTADAPRFSRDAAIGVSPPSVRRLCMELTQKQP